MSEESSFSLSIGSIEMCTKPGWSLPFLVQSKQMHFSVDTFSRLVLSQILRGNNRNGRIPAKRCSLPLHTD